MGVCCQTVLAVLSSMGMCCSTAHTFLVLHRYLLLDSPSHLVHNGYWVNAARLSSSPLPSMGMHWMAALIFLALHGYALLDSP